jgi:hypothetical protein
VEASHDTLLRVGFHYTFDDFTSVVGGTILKKGHWDCKARIVGVRNG